MKGNNPHPWPGHPAIEAKLRGEVAQEGPVLVLLGLARVGHVDEKHHVLTRGAELVLVSVRLCYAKGQRLRRTAQTVSRGPERAFSHARDRAELIVDGRAEDQRQQRQPDCLHVYVICARPAWRGGRISFLVNANTECSAHTGTSDRERGSGEW